VLYRWGRDAEFASKYVTKGARIGVRGMIDISSYNDRQTGEEMVSNKVTVKDLEVLETKAEAQLRQRNQNSVYNRQYGQEVNSLEKRSNDDYGDGPSAAGTGSFFD